MLPAYWKFQGTLVLERTARLPVFAKTIAHSIHAFIVDADHTAPIR